MNFKTTVYQSPVLQAVCVFFMAITAFTVSASGFTQISYDWIIAVSGLLLFALSNAILGIFQKKWLRYTGLSIASYAILLITLYALTNKLSPIQEVKHYRIVMLTITVFYLMIIGLTALFRAIIRFLEEAED
jgi:hypothetical protein